MTSAMASFQTFAAAFDTPRLQLHQSLCDAQPDPQSSIRTIKGRVDLKEHLEQLR